MFQKSGWVCEGKALRKVMAMAAVVVLAGCLPNGDSLDSRPGGGAGGSGESGPGLTDEQITVTAPPAVATVPYRFQPDYPALAGANVVYGAVALPSWASIDAATGVIGGTPGAGDVAARVPIAVTATGSGQRVEVRSVIQVRPAEALRTRDGLSFYATDFGGVARVLRNDLTEGALQGEVQLMQSHAAAPQNNYVENSEDQTQSRYMPKAVPLRETLLLFIPAPGVQPTTLHVQVSVPGQAMTTRAMAPPAALPASDYTGSGRVEYSHRAWSVVLPWTALRNGLSLRFVADAGSGQQQYGVLPAEHIEFGRPSRMVIQSIRLGMLTDPGHSSQHYTLTHPILAATDYFQTLPVARLVMGSYADVHLPRVILADGTLYCEAQQGEPGWDPRCDNTDGKSRTDGGAYNGDMRENVAKSQVSVGINMANYGYPTNNMRQSFPAVFKQITVHHAWGMYQNGRQAHGLSGGNGIATLYASRGNEASHEWGHNWLGHYPGRGLTADGRWAKDNPDTGWGYIAFRNRMRATIEGTVAEDGCSPFQPGGLYCFVPSPMSGGYSVSPFSVYTRYTGYDARIIQNKLSRFPTPVAASAAFPSGYKLWNTTTGQYEDYDNDRPVPVEVGVPVATILGGYDPDSAACATDPTGCEALIYPVFHGNYGNLFALPEPSPTGDQCWIEVGNAAAETLRVALPAPRDHPSTINQINFNVAAGFKPTTAQLYCRRGGQVALLTQRTFDPAIPPLPPVAIVGQEYGYDMLREREMAEIESALLATPPLRVLAGDLAAKVQSYTGQELRDGLSVPAWSALAALRQARQAVTRIDVLLNYSASLGLPDSERAQQLLDNLKDSGLVDSPADLQPEGDVIKVPGPWGPPFHYLNIRLDDGKYVTMTEHEDPADASRWVIDLQGRIHPVDTPWLCLVPSGERVTLAMCRNGIASHRWSDTITDQGHHLLRNQGNNKCLNYDRARNWLITWGCSGSWNEQWRNVTTSTSPALSLMEGALMKKVHELLRISF